MICEFIDILAAVYCVTLSLCVCVDSAFRLWNAFLSCVRSVCVFFKSFVLVYMYIIFTYVPFIATS